MWLPYAVKFPLGAWHDIKFVQRHYIEKKEFPPILMTFFAKQVHWREK